MDYSQFYQINASFRAYVDKYCNDYNYTVDEALGHALVREVAGYYREQETGKGEKNLKNAGKAFTGDLGNGIPV